MKIWQIDEDGCVFHWVIAADADAAKALAIKCFPEINPDTEEIGCEEVPAEKELTFHAEIKPIKHTAEEWLIIYDYAEEYLGCSEF